MPPRITDSQRKAVLALLAQGLVGDDKSAVSRQLARKVVNSYSFAETAELITRLPRGWAYFISENVGRVVRIHAFEARMARWRQQHTP